jgi:hypothetical protein
MAGFPRRAVAARVLPDRRLRLRVVVARPVAGLA